LSFDLLRQLFFQKLDAVGVCRNILVGTHHLEEDEWLVERKKSTYEMGSGSQPDKPLAISSSH
jgi:hypothetical protein